MYLNRIAAVIDRFGDRQVEGYMQVYDIYRSGGRYCGEWIFMNVQRVYNEH